MYTSRKRWKQVPCTADSVTVVRLNFARRIRPKTNYFNLVLFFIRSGF